MDASFHRRTSKHNQPTTFTTLPPYSRTKPRNVPSFLLPTTILSSTFTHARVGAPAKLTDSRHEASTPFNWVSSRVSPPRVDPAGVVKNMTSTPPVVSLIYGITHSEDAKGLICTGSKSTFPTRALTSTQKLGSLNIYWCFLSSLQKIKRPSESSRVQLNSSNSLEKTWQGCKI